MEGKRLTGYVHITNPDTGEACVFGPDDDVPDWAEELITNPSAWSFTATHPETGEEVTMTIDDALGQMSRPQLVTALEDMGLVAGEDFPASAGKERLAQILRERASAPHEEPS